LFSTPSVEATITAGMVLVGTSIIAILSAFYGNISVTKAGFIIIGLIVFYVAWLSGIFSTLLHTPPNDPGARERERALNKTRNRKERKRN